MLTRINLLDRIIYSKFPEVFRPVMWNTVRAWRSLVGRSATFTWKLGGHTLSLKGVATRGYKLWPL